MPLTNLTTPIPTGAVTWVSLMNGGGTMIATTLLTAVTLTVGLILYVAATTRQRATRRTVRIAAMLHMLWSATMLAALLWPLDTSPLRAELWQSAWGIHAGVMAISLCVSMLAILRMKNTIAVTMPALAQSDSEVNRLYQRICRALAASSTLNEMLAQTAEQLRHGTHARQAVVFKYDPIRRIIKRTAVIDEHAARSYPKSQTDLDRTTMSESFAWECIVNRDVRVGITAHQTQRCDIAIPISTSGTTYAVIALSQADIRMHNEAALGLLRGIAAVLGRAVADWTAAVRGIAPLELTEKFADLLPRLTAAIDLTTGIRAISASIMTHPGADYLSLAWLDQSQSHEDRVSISSDDNRLVENLNRWPVSATTHKVQTMKRSLHTPDLQYDVDDETSNSESWEYLLGMRSRLVTPIVGQNRRVIGTLTLANRTPGRFDEATTQSLEAIGAVCALWLTGLSTRRLTDRAVAGERLMTELSSDPYAWTDERAILESTRSFVSATCMRLYRLAPDGDRMTEVCTVGRAYPHDAKTQSSLSLMPWHRVALERRGSVRIDQDDPESHMDLSEADRTLASDMRTAMIIPVYHGTDALGFLDICESRDPDRTRLDRVDQSLLTTAAIAIAQRWAMSPAFGMWGQSGIDKMLSTNPIRDSLREAVNPVTSIIGCVELIRHKHPDLQPDMIKYLSTIERSAVRINETLNLVARSETQEKILTDVDTELRTVSIPRPASLLMSATSGMAPN